MRGFFADASVALLIVGAAGFLFSVRRWWGRAVGMALVVSFVWLSFAMYEFIAVFDSLYALSHAGFLADSTFVGGSVLHVRHPALVALATALAIAGGAWARPPGHVWWRWWGVALATCVLGQVLVPMSEAQDEWRQRHALQANLSILPASAGVGSAAIRAEIGEVFRGNLRGERWVGPLSDRPNVLLVLIEAASGAHLPSVAAAEGVVSATTMPKLDELAQHHILFTHVVSHQRQTNRGEYGILCGDYPKLLTDQSKMTEQVYGAARRCLPSVLRDEGYATAYIQSAPLGFMLKDQFMRKAGFEELVGDPWFERSYARSDWGVDDKAFFEQSLARVVELHDAERPFFATMLTVGPPVYVPGCGNRGRSTESAGARLSMGRRRTRRVPDPARTTWGAAGHGRDHHFRRVGGACAGSEPDAKAALTELVICDRDDARAARETYRHALRARRYGSFGDRPPRLGAAGESVHGAQLVPRLRHPAAGVCGQHVCPKRHHVGAFGQRHRVRRVVPRLHSLCPRR
ncbi:MAG: sulfatase-like hydrolase/transferase [Deltaproteobacteria bacterium]|nr:sulfatase-like hydrolase/transferase [Deltaproteobacteria bacterium]